MPYSVYIVCGILLYVWQLTVAYFVRIYRNFLAGLGEQAICIEDVEFCLVSNEVLS